MLSEDIRVVQNIAADVQLVVGIEMLMVVVTVVEATGEVVVDMTDFAEQNMLQSVLLASMYAVPWKAWVALVLEDLLQQVEAGEA